MSDGGAASGSGSSSVKILDNHAPRSQSPVSTISATRNEREQHRRPLIPRSWTSRYAGTYTQSSSSSSANYGTLPGASGRESPVPSQSKSGTSTPRLANARHKIAKVATSRHWRYYIPICNWLPEYTASGFAGDFAAALTLTCLLVPQSMSYAASLARLDPVNGLFGVIVPTFIYALVGTCGQLSVGPEAALSLLVGQTVDKLALPFAHLPAQQLEDLRTGIASAIVFEVGLITFLLGILRLGFLDAVLSRALLRGFITAVAFVIFIEQLIPLLGLGQLAKAHGVSSKPPIDKLFFVIENISHVHRLTALVSFVSLVLLVTARVNKPKLRKKLFWVTYIPEILIVAVVTTILCAQLNWDKRGVDILGKVSAGAVHLHFPIHSGRIWQFAFSSEVVSSAVTIAIMGYVDSIVAAKQNSSLFNYAISPNRELTALGLANLGASVISGTIPGYGSITRSRLAANAGARSPMTSFLVSVLVLLSTFFLLQYLYYLPKAVLGCIVALVVYSILAEMPEDVAFFVHMEAWTDLSLMALTFFLTLLSSVQTGIIVSVAVSLVLVVKQSSQSIGVQIMGRIPGTDQWAPVEDAVDDDYLDLTEEVPGVLIVRLRERLHFANTGALKERLRRLERYGTKRHHPSDLPHRGEAQTIVLHMKDLIGIDASAIQILQESCQNYAQRGVQVYFAHVEGELRRKLEKAHLFDLIGRDHVQSSVKECLDAIQAPLPVSREEV